MTTEEEVAQINAAMENWRQGDFFLSEDLFFIHLADLARPLTSEADEIASERIETGDTLEVEGVPSAVIGYGYHANLRYRPGLQGTELRRHRPLVEVEPSVVNQTRLLRRPAFAFVPGASDKNLIADLDRILTVEKSFLSKFDCTVGCRDDSERRVFADALPATELALLSPMILMTVCVLFGIT